VISAITASSSTAGHRAASAWPNLSRTPRGHQLRDPTPESHNPLACLSCEWPFSAGTEVEVISQYYAWYRTLMGITANGDPAPSYAAD
jgi:hypothetical protein